MGEFSHFIVTRFNIRGGSVGWRSYKSNKSIVYSSPPDLDWLAHRFDLFERFCFPSVSSQTNLDFKWLVFFDVDTPPAFKEKVGSYAEWDRFIPCYVGDSIDKQGIIRRHMSRGARFVITTRLDTDDALGAGFVETVQSAFSGQHFEFINLTHGYVLDLNKDRLYGHKHPSNPFLSLIESVDEFKTVYCGDHGELLSTGQVKQLDTRPLWLLVVHGGNVTSEVTTDCIRVPIASLGDDFVLNYTPASDSEKLLALRLENLANQARSLISRGLPAPLKALLKLLIRSLRSAPHAES